MTIARRNRRVVAWQGVVYRKSEWVGVLPSGRIKLIHPAKISKYDPGLPAVP